MIRPRHWPNVAVQRYGRIRQQAAGRAAYRCGWILRLRQFPSHDDPDVSTSPNRASADPFANGISSAIALGIPGFLLLSARLCQSGLNIDPRSASSAEQTSVNVSGPTSSFKRTDGWNAAVGSGWQRHLQSTSQLSSRNQPPNRIGGFCVIVLFVCSRVISPFAVWIATSSRCSSETVEPASTSTGVSTIPLFDGSVIVVFDGLPTCTSPVLLFQLTLPPALLHVLQSSKPEPELSS